MNIISIKNIKKVFNGEILFDNISFDINSGEKIALIGRNGVGKSTLLKIITDELHCDGGSLFINNKSSIGYLSQNVISSYENSLIEEIEQVFETVINTKIKLDEITKKLEVNPHDDKLLNSYSKKESEYERLGGYEYKYLIDTVLTKFNFTKDLYDRKISTFSGGEKTRVAFSKLLLKKPDLLILDEPTNHLDIEIVEWLEDYLKSYSGSLLIVTHDKYFINKVCNKVIEINRSTSDVYHGNYDFYEVEKVKRYEILMKKYNKQQKEIAHLQSFVDRFRYNQKRSSLAQDRVKKINRIDKIDKPTNSTQHVKMNFRKRRVTTDVIMTIKDLSIGYDSVLQSNINLEMSGFDKIAIIGPNGIGKTTLLKVVEEKLAPISGKIEKLRKYKFGYFEQNQDTLNLNNTIFDEIQGLYPKLSNGEVRSVAARFLFIGEEVFKEISVLSGGEKVRLVLLLLMLSEPEFLLLDEPTNHLDLDTKRIIEEVFYDFTGPIIFVSHDRYFINRIATKIMSFSENNVSVFNGNYDEYKESLIQNEEMKKPKKKKPIKKVDNKKMLLNYEKDIHALEEKISDIKDSLFLPENYLDKRKCEKINDEVHLLESKLNILYDEYIDMQGE